MSHLGILVHSTARIDWVFQLAKAACARGKTVWVHFAENGVFELCDREIEKLSQYGKVTICIASAERFGLQQRLSRRCGANLAPPSVVAELVRACERHVVL